MYNGDGLDEDISSCKYVGIDIGGRGIDCGIGDGGCSNNAGFFALDDGLDWARSKGSGRGPDNPDLRLGEVWRYVSLVYKDRKSVV